MRVEHGDDAAPQDAEAGRSAVPAAEPGARLREIREARGVDPDDLARELNLTPRMLAALEADAYDRLPGPTFIRGYIRSCARQLGEDPEPLLEAYEARAGRIEPVVHASPRLENARLDTQLVQRRPALATAGVSVVMLGLVAVALLAWLGLGLGPESGPRTARESGTTTLDVGPDRASGADIRAGKDDEVEAPRMGFDASIDVIADASVDVSADAEADADAAAGTAAVADPAIAVASATIAAENAGGSEALAGLLGAGGAAAGTGPATAEPTPSVAQRGDDGALQVVAGGEDHLRFAFTADCWVEVRDAEDVAVYQDLALAGQTLDLWGQAPFRIRLGYAPAVELAYNDTQVPLIPHTRNDIANLVIGR